MRREPWTSTILLAKLPMITIRHCCSRRSVHSASLPNAICSVLFVCFDTIGSDGLGVDDRSSIFRASPASAAAAASHGYLFVQADAQERGAEPQRRGAKTSRCWLFCDRFCLTSSRFNAFARCLLAHYQRRSECTPSVHYPRALLRSFHRYRPFHPFIHSPILPPTEPRLSWHM